MKAFNIKGGFMYSLFPGPRYAYRELAYRKIITGRSYSTTRVSGERLLRILNRALAYAGDPSALQAVSPAEAGPEPAALAGSADGRMRVSLDRARAVADYLAGLGCRNRDEITLRGYGAERP
jgi:hypothetical protein